MKKPTKFLFFHPVLSFFLLMLKISSAIDIINTTQILRDGNTLVSSGGTFELGFFSPGNPINRYVGIWFKRVPKKTVVWVANRETPVKGTRGVLKVMETGLLVLLLNDTNNIVWSSNTTRVAQTPVLQLLDSGNLILREVNDDRPQKFLWQSFDHLSDTFLPGVNSGWTSKRGLNYQSSWKTNEDPAPGEYMLYMDRTGYPQLLLKKGDVIVTRMGPWNGLRYSGIPNAKLAPTYRFIFVMDENNTYYREETVDSSIITRITLSPTGVVQRWVWVDRTQEWVGYLNIPADYCDTYKLCGTYGSCNIATPPFCRCLAKFVPKDPEGWVSSDWSNGCVRRTPLNCAKGDVFLKYSGIKLPDARHSWFKRNMTLKGCSVECLKSCTCMAYTQIDIRTEGSGCLFWSEELIDIRYLSIDGEDIYIRMASSELDSETKQRRINILGLTSLMVVVLGLSLTLCYWRRKKSYAFQRIGDSERYLKEFELRLFDLSTISKATNSFSINNMLGQGGYGPVYKLRCLEEKSSTKGTLQNGVEIAVKRLSRTSTQGTDEFKNEVICIAKLQHRNLVKLLGCCIEGEEKMLIYEYMPNKSLDLILFDQSRSTFLDWSKRLHIVKGVARGLMYIHQDSQLRIIHRDLKASNILLDSDMNPKISDFGIAKSFFGNETGDKTNRVIGTYGYMSPEYAVHGRFSVKSDVFSFGVLLLEILSGMRNSGYSLDDQNLNLLGHAWTLFKEERSSEFADAYILETANPSEVERLIHIGLLCVQQRPHDRPSMAAVVAVLDNEITLPPANPPGFFTEREMLVANSRTNCSSNEVTITELEAR